MKQDHDRKNICFIHSSIQQDVSCAILLHNDKSNETESCSKSIPVSSSDYMKCEYTKKHSNYFTQGNKRIPVKHPFKG
jgi:hypothetical protein